MSNKNIIVYHVVEVGMNLIELKKPQKPANGNIIFGTPMNPASKLETISDKEFEQTVVEWAFSYLKSKYYDVYRLGDSGDKGRDLIAYYSESKDKFDMYQCKHYKKPLSPSNYWTEFGKLCYYTYSNQYKVPQKYFIVASKGVGQELRDLIDNPERINPGLIDNWGKYCASGIINKKIVLDDKLRDYIQQFDFSIVNDISPIKLLDQYSQTPWFKYRFGGGLIKRPAPEQPPANISNEESQLLYIMQLLSAYSEHTNSNMLDIVSLKSNKKLFEHFTRQRECFYSAQSLKRFARDELIDESLYDDIKKEIHYCVADICNQDYDDGFLRANATLDKARLVPLDVNDLGKINPSDKSGICHELVNDEKLKWVEEDDK